MDGTLLIKIKFNHHCNILSVHHQWLLLFQRTIKYPKFIYEVINDVYFEVGPQLEASVLICLNFTFFITVPTHFLIWKWIYLNIFGKVHSWDVSQQCWIKVYMVSFVLLFTIHCIRQEYFHSNNYLHPPVWFLASHNICIVFFFITWDNGWHPISLGCNKTSVTLLSKVVQYFISKKYSSKFKCGFSMKIFLWWSHCFPWTRYIIC